MSKTPKNSAPEVDQEIDLETAAAPAAAPEKGVNAVGKVTVASVYGKIKVADLPALQVAARDKNGNVVIEASGAPKMIDNPEGVEKKIVRIAGYVSGVKSGTTQYGDWNALTGEFAATNLDTGEMFMGKTGIIPGAMGDALVDTATLRLSEDASAKVAFSVIVSVKRSARNPDEKYEYVVRPVMDAKISSPAMALLQLGM